MTNTTIKKVFLMVDLLTPFDFLFPVKITGLLNYYN